jgi:hypothetical protein
MASSSIAFDGGHPSGTAASQIQVMPLISLPSAAPTLTIHFTQQLFSPLTNDGRVSHHDESSFIIPHEVGNDNPFRPDDDPEPAVQRPQGGKLNWIEFDQKKI